MEAKLWAKEVQFVLDLEEHFVSLGTVIATLFTSTLPLLQGEMMLRGNLQQRKLVMIHWVIRMRTILPLKILRILAENLVKRWLKKFKRQIKTKMIRTRLLRRRIWLPVALFSKIHGRILIKSLLYLQEVELRRDQRYVYLSHREF